MRLAIISEDQLADQIADWWGDPSADEALLDLIRSEVSSRRSTPRWATLRRLERILGEGRGDLRSRLLELCETLEFQGDIICSTGGILHSAPVRGVRLQKGVHRIVCSLPTKRLVSVLPGKLEIDGVWRLHRFDPVEELLAEESVQALGGAVVSAEAWAGLSLAPVADQKWLETLGQRLDWQSESVGSLERDGPLDWQALVFFSGRTGWSRKAGSHAQLWRARSLVGRWIWAWTFAGQSPATGAFVRLTGDEASRSVFAIGRINECPVSSTLARGDSNAYLNLYEWLPRAEYRYLTALGSVSRIDKYFRWSIPLPRIDDAVTTLRKRLGLEVKESLSL